MAGRKGQGMSHRMKSALAVVVIFSFEMFAVRSHVRWLGAVLLVGAASLLAIAVWSKRRD
jgi:uncharacterized membrane protein YbaN (DUF454 family)